LTFVVAVLLAFVITTSRVTGNEERKNGCYQINEKEHNPGDRRCVMKKLLLLAFLALYSACTIAQQTAAPGWTDTNNGEMYAAYMLRVAYYERGYMAANVMVKQVSGHDVYTVEPGPTYHFKSVNVAGVPQSYLSTVMQEAPKTGDVYSAARVNEWLAHVKQKAENEGRMLKVVHQEMRLDHANATANVLVTFE
jgi:hypothetical protein